MNLSWSSTGKLGIMVRATSLSLFIVLAIWFYNVEALTLKPLGIFWVFLGICGQINILTQFFKGGFLGICG